MPKARDYHLKKPELERIDHAIHHDPRPEMRLRCTVIRLLHLGYKPEEIAEMQSISVPSVYNWVRRWRQGGLEGLATKPRSGRPPIADEAYAQALEGVLQKDPGDLGYRFRIWTVERLRSHLKKQTGIELSESALRQVLKRKGFRYRRPKADLGHLQDKKAKAQASELLEELKKRSSETISSFSLWTKRP
jgi:transposase